MRVHAFQRADGQKRYLLLDDAEVIVDLPTRFGFACASRTRYSKETVREWMSVLKLFCQELSRRGFEGAAQLDDAIATIGPLLIEDWFIHLRNIGKSAATLRNRDSALKKFMSWLTTQEAGQIRTASDQPYADGKLKTPKPHEPAAQLLTYQEVSDFICRGFQNESERCIAHFMFDTGVRVSEVARVVQADLPNIDSYPVSVMYFPLVIKGSKGSGGGIKQRYTIISRPMLERLLRLHNNWRTYLRAQVDYSPGHMPVFLNVLGKPITKGAIQKQIHLASKMLRKTGVLLKNITPHSFRHGTAFSILQSEHGREFLENMVVCQRALGHNDIKTTERYTKIPAPIIAQMQQLGSQEGPRERYLEAQYIYEQSFKSQRNHTEKRGHGRRQQRHGK